MSNEASIFRAARCQVEVAGRICREAAVFLILVTTTPKSLSIRVSTVPRVPNPNLNIRAEYAMRNNRVRSVQKFTHVLLQSARHDSIERELEK